MFLKEHQTVGLQYLHSYYLMMILRHYPFRLWYNHQYHQYFKNEKYIVKQNKDGILS